VSNTRKGNAAAETGPEAAERFRRLTKVDALRAKYERKKKAKRQAIA
jgi:hypothetical protein